MAYLSTTSCKSTWDAVPYFGISGLSMILCLWSPLHPLSKLLAIQDHTQNLEEQLWMGGRREVSIISYRPVTRSDLKQERSFFRGSDSTFLQLVVAMFNNSKKKKKTIEMMTSYYMATIIRADSDGLPSCNDWTLPATYETHIQSVFNLIVDILMDIHAMVNWQLSKRYPLTSVALLYCGLNCTTHWGDEVFFKVIRWPAVGFN